MPGKHDPYTPRVSEALDRVLKAGDFTEEDFANLALVCLDQAGVPTDRQAFITKMFKDLGVIAADG